MKTVELESSVNAGEKKKIKTYGHKLLTNGAEKNKCAPSELEETHFSHYANATC